LGAKVKMKFAIGYQLPDEGEQPFADVIRDFKEYIEEVYFSWLDMPSGRAPLGDIGGVIDWEAQRKLEKDLEVIKKMGIKLDLLFNANCYGKYSLSRYLANLICSTIDYLNGKFGLDVVTTTSLMIAKVVKENFKDIDVRASVNMRIGTINGMQYVSHLFDSFYIQREYNRDFQRIKEIKEWSDLHNKGLYLLANSGCMTFCSGQTFHDNLVAHEKQINEMTNINKESPALCWDYYRNKNNWVSILQSSWIRPEDIKNYQGYFSTMKLATRMHANPSKVIQAYVEQKFNGNLLDLLEPSHEPLLLGYIVDNSKFPHDWFERVTKCDKKCHKCNYCDSVLKQVLARVGF